MYRCVATKMAASQPNRTEWSGTTVIPFWLVNPLAPGRYGIDFKSVVYSLYKISSWALCDELLSGKSHRISLTHWGRVRHICVSKLTIIGSDNGLSPGRRQAIIWTNEVIFLIRTFQTHFSDIVSEIHTFSFKKTHFKMSSGKCRPSCLGLNVFR